MRFARFQASSPLKPEAEPETEPLLERRGLGSQKWDGQLVFRPTRNCGPLGQDKHMEGVQCATAMDAQRLTDHAHGVCCRVACKRYP